MPNKLIKYRIKAKSQKGSNLKLLDKVLILLERSSNKPTKDGVLVRDYSVVSGLLDKIKAKASSWGWPDDAVEREITRLEKRKKELKAKLEINID